ncbi:MAG TPA: STAS domain-containing protein [Bacilli bacterium]|nr:STAS domain-containing protein [Bacilli bacterium]
MKVVEAFRQVAEDQQGILLEWMQRLAEGEYELLQRLGVDYTHRQSELLLGEYVAMLEKDPDTFQLKEEELIVKLVDELSMHLLRQGVTPHAFKPYMYALKGVIARRLKQHPDTDIDNLFDGYMVLDTMMNKIMYYYYESYISRREQVIQSQAMAIQELSTPVIQVWTGILVLPLVGAVDTQRAKVVMENLLAEIVRTKSPHVIIDITGVPIVDTGVAERLIKTVDAARLVGAECVLTGIRPEVAQTLVMLGVDLSGITTKATLQHSLSYLLDKQREQSEQSDAAPREKSV